MEMGWAWRKRFGQRNQEVARFREMAEPKLGKYFWLQLGSKNRPDLQGRVLRTPYPVHTYPGRINYGGAVHVSAPTACGH